MTIVTARGGSEAKPPIILDTAVRFRKTRIVMKKLWFNPKVAFVA
jgi:hypothetical protein